MSNEKSASSTRLLWVACLCGVTGLVGCGGGPRLESVSGKVTLQGSPLTAGIVTFTPDASKGNTSKLTAFGKIGEGGSYTIVTDGKDGAAAGWYKVSVSTDMPPMDAPIGKPAASITLNPKYKNPETSGLAIEVVASPNAGAYDLPLLK